MQEENFISDFSKNSKYHWSYHEIYHYTSGEGLIGIMRDKELWFTNIYFLNDNNELLYTYKLIKNLVDNLDIEKDLKELIIGRCNYILQKNYLSSESQIWYRRNYYVASFSTNKDNLNLWNYYTKTDKTGYNIKFQWKTFTQDDFQYGKVCYKLDEQETMLKQTISNANKEYKKDKSTWEKLWENFIIYSLFFKHPKYSQEEEYRFVLTKNSHDEECKECSFRSKNGLIIPYVPYNFFNKFIPSNCLDRPISGIMISPLNQGEITKYGVDRLCCSSGFSEMDIIFSEMDMK